MRRNDWWWNLAWAITYIAINAVLLWLLFPALRAAGAYIRDWCGSNFRYFFYSVGVQYQHGAGITAATSSHPHPPAFANWCGIAWMWTRSSISMLSTVGYMPVRIVSELMAESKKPPCFK